MADKPSIQCAKNGPLLVKSLDSLVELKSGKVHELSGGVALCRCGSSSNKPFCDGTHKTIAPGGPYVIRGSVELVDVKWGAGASREHYDLCRCGQSGNKPFCDGSHHESTFDD